MELLERELPLAQLGTALGEALAGAGRICLVSGEAGIGKTSLVQQFADQKRVNIAILTGSCDALFTPRPLGPLQDMAAQLLESFPDLLNPSTNRSSVFNAFLNELQRRSVLAIFEDIHWADDATLDLLRYLGRRIAQTRSLLILTYRDDGLGPHHPLRALLGDLISSATVRRIHLGPLSEGAVSKLISGREFEANTLHRQTGGNPFFVTEVLASPGGSIPISVRDAVLARTSPLTPGAYAILEIAAIIGPRIESWLLDAAAGESDGGIEECLSMGMLVAHGPHFGFRHELARQVVLETISPSRKRTLHREILELLRSSLNTRGDLARLAYHADAAGNAPAVLEYAPAAARQATSASAHRTAAALYELSLRYAGDLPRVERARILHLYALECNSIDERILGIQLLRSALEVWRELQDPLNQGMILSQLANMLIGLGKDREAMQYSREALDILEAHPPGRELASAYRVQGTLDLIHRNLAESMAWHEKSLALTIQLADTSEYFTIQAMLGSTLLHIDYERGCQHMEHYLAAADAADKRAVAALIYANLGSISSELHQFSRAEHQLNEGLAYITRHDLYRLKYYMQAWLAFTHLNLGYWNEAAENASTVIREARGAVVSRLVALVTLGRLRARRGDPQTSSLLNEALELTRDMVSIERMGLVQTARAETAWLAGDLTRAAEEARAVYELALAKRHPWLAAELAFWLWRAGVRVTTQEWMGQPYVLQIQGDWQGAAKAWEDLGCPYEQAWALADGDLQARRAALVIFQRLGAYPAAETIRHRLHAYEVPRLPPRPRSATRQNPFGLTQRQLDILALLDEGLTNSEIASRVQISPKTADHHVAAILEKMDVHTREAAAALARFNPDFKKYRESLKKK